MDEQAQEVGIRYENHLGESIDLKNARIFGGRRDLADWKIESTSLNGRTTSFYRKRKSQTFSLRISAESDSSGMDLRNELYSVAIKDVEGMKPGRLYIDGWYLECFVVESKKSDHYLFGRFANYELGLLADDPRWTREHVFEFPKGTSKTDWLNYPHNYPYNFGAGGGSRVISNPAVLPSAAKIVVYGPANAPKVFIGGNAYEVEADVPDGGYLVIDGASSPPLITLVHGDGTEENAFGLRRGVQKKGSGSYVFEPVKPGKSGVTWDGTFGLTLVLYEKSDERGWVACT